MQPHGYSGNNYPSKPGQSGSFVYHGYSKGISIGLGVCHIVFGTLALILNAVGLVQHAHSLAGIGMWGGMFLITTGLLGIFAGLKRNRCPVISFLVCSIISLIMAVLIAVTAGLGVNVDKTGGRPEEYYRRWYLGGYDVEHKREERVAYGVCVLVCGALDIPIALASIIFVSRHVCCGDARQPLINNQKYASPGLPGEMPPYADQPSTYPPSNEPEKKAVPGLPYSVSEQMSGGPPQGPPYNRGPANDSFQGHNQSIDSQQRNIPGAYQVPIMPINDSFSSEPYSRKSKNVPQAQPGPPPMENQGAFHHIEGPVHSGQTLKRKSQEKSMTDSDAEHTDSLKRDSRKPADGYDSRPMMPIPLGNEPKRGPPPPLETSVTESEPEAAKPHVPEMRHGHERRRSGRNKSRAPGDDHPDVSVELQSLDNSRLNQSQLSRASTDQSQMLSTSVLSGEPMEEGERRVQGFNFRPFSRASSTQGSLPPFRPPMQAYRPPVDPYMAYNAPVPYNPSPQQTMNANRPPPQPYRPPAIHRHQDA